MIYVILNGKIVHRLKNKSEVPKNGLCRNIYIYGFYEYKHLCETTTRVHKIVDFRYENIDLEKSITGQCWHITVK